MALGASDEPNSMLDPDAIATRTYCASHAAHGRRKWKCNLGSENSIATKFVIVDDDKRNVYF
jgi:hypothetical protein